MNDAQYEILKNRVQDCQEKWKTILPLGTWTITPYYWRDKWDTDHHGYDCIAYTAPHWEYLFAEVNWNMSKLFDLDPDDEQLDSYVVHEYTHLLIDELVDYATERDKVANIGQVERITSTLTLGFLWARSHEVEKVEDYIG